MRGFNVATFVNILIVGLVALTISLFVFAGPKTRKTAPWLDSSRDAVVERDAQEAFDVGAAPEAGEEVEPVATEVAATETVDAAEEGVVGKARNVGMDALFATALEGSDVGIEAEANEESGAEPDVASVAEVAELDSLFADAAVEENVADVEAEPVAVESDAVAVAEPVSDEDVELDSLFADDAVEESVADVAVAEPVAVEENIADADAEPVAVEVVELDSLFAEDAVEENVADVAAEPIAVESDAVAVAEPVAVEAVELDSLFAEDAAVEENVADVAVAEPVAVEENVADVAAEPIAVESDAVAVAEPVAVEAVELDSLFADAAVEENVADVAEQVAVESDAVAVAEPVADDVVELDSLFADAAVEENVADVADAESIAVESDAVAVAEPVAVEVVELDSLFAEDAAVEENVADVADAESIAVESDAVAVAEPVAVEVVELDSLFAEDAAVEENVADVAVAEPVAVEENVADVAVAEPVAVEVVELDSLFVEDAVEENVADDAVAVESDAAVEENIADAVAVEENVADAAVESVAVEENVADVAVEPVAVEENVADAAVESDAAVEENVAEPVAVEENVAEETNDAETLETDDAAQAEFVAVSVSADANETNETIVATDAEEKAEEKFEVAPSARENEFWILGQAGNGVYLYRLQSGTWVAKDAADFYADSAEFATVVYAHGYQTDMNDATRDAAAFKTVLDAAKRNVGAKRAFRLVVWKWNSERDAARIRIDAQAKATLADQSGKALGRFLQNVDENADLALVGFSFGARVVGSALETLAKNDAQTVALDVEFDENDEFAFAVSGKLSVDAAQASAAESYASEANVANVADDESERKIALVLVAAACDLGSFEARGVYGRGATLPTAVLNVYNPNDFALKYYRHVSETRSDAQGVAPIRAGLFPNAVGQTFNINSNPTLGKRHSFVDALGTVPTRTLGALAF